MIWMVHFSHSLPDRPLDRAEVGRLDDLLPVQELEIDDLKLASAMILGNLKGFV